jgi:hypothetical protein
MVIASKPLHAFMADYPEEHSLEDIMVHLERSPLSFDGE